MTTTGPRCPDCDRPAGYGTEHAGTGPCALHEGPDALDDHRPRGEDLFSPAAAAPSPRTQAVEHGLSVARAELRGESAIDNMGGFREYVKRRNRSLLRFEHVPRLVDVGERVVRGDLRHVMVILPPRYFKALADDTPIATPDGWTRMGDLQAGDQVFGPDGRPTTVIATQHFDDRPLYRVQTGDGASVLADGDHLWTVRQGRKKRTRRWVERTTRELAERQARGGRTAMIPLWDALELPTATDLPVPPYTLGAWLGDGRKSGATLFMHDDDAPAMTARIAADGYEVHRRSPERIAYAVYGGGGRWDRATSLTSALRRAGVLNNKHIPPAYMRASVQQRMELLQGLVDTDGTVSKRSGRVTFYTTSPRLCDDVRQLVWSLGTKCSVHERRARLRGKDCGPYYHVSFYAGFAAGLPRKAQHARPAHRARSRYLTVTATDQRGPVTCIQVLRDDGLFLAGRGLMVTHNSEVFSRLLPGYFLRQRPDYHAAIISYAAELAWDLSADARTNYQADGGSLKLDTAAKKRWATDAGGELWAAGVGGPMLGFGYHLAVIDDPVDPEKAVSPAYQRRFREWFPSKFLSRREPDNRIVIVMQRLSVDDPIDYLFRREVGEDADHAPMHWHVVFCDEVKSDQPLGRWDGPRGLPPTCTLEPDPRDVGDVLSPSRWTPDQVAQIHVQSGPYVTATQRQGRPMEPKGDFWARDWFDGCVYDTLPDDAYNGGWDWDTAYTKEEANAATAGVRSFRGPGDAQEFPIYVEDVEWDWMEFPHMVEYIKGLQGPHYVEAKATGKSARQALQRNGVPAQEVPVQGDKFARAAAAQPVVANKRIKVRRAVLHTLLSGERQGLLRVTAERLLSGGPDIDLNDAFVQAIHRHTGGRRSRRVKGARLGSVTKPGGVGNNDAGGTGSGGRGRIRIGFTG